MEVVLCVVRVVVEMVEDTVVLEVVEDVVSVVVVVDDELVELLPEVTIKKRVVESTPLPSGF